MARTKQLALDFRPWGGARKNAGRKPRRFRPSEPHQVRERFHRPVPVHVTLRLVRGFGALRRRDTYFAIRKATRVVLGRSDFRIVHISPENDHIHLIVEADHTEALGRGVQAFEISAARHLNRAISKRRGTKRRGQVFADRYHARIIRSPTQARHAINYVLNNWRRHDQDEVSIDVRSWDVDYMSSAVSFGGWKELVSRGFDLDIDPAVRLCVARPETWLLATGWRKAGDISMYAVPGRS